MFGRFLEGIVTELPGTQLIQGCSGTEGFVARTGNDQDANFIISLHPCKAIPNGLQFLLPQGIVALRIVQGQATNMSSAAV